MKYSIIPNYVWDHLSDKMGKNHLPSVSAKIGSIKARSTRNQILKLPKSLKDKLFDSVASKNRIEVYDRDDISLLNSDTIHPSENKIANQVYEQVLVVLRFLEEELGRDSYDGRGHTVRVVINADLNFGKRPEVQWDDNRMYFGIPNDMSIFNSFTSDIEVFGHELAHPMIIYEGKLCYESEDRNVKLSESGALHEHYADVFGIMVKHWFYEQIDPKLANWEIGSNMFQSGNPLRSMGNTAFIDDFGSGLHPVNIDDFRPEKGYHFNASIPNHAFYLATCEVGRPSWEIIGKIWYEALKSKHISECSSFEEVAKATLSVAKEMGEPFSDAQQALEEAWKKVKVKIN
ncbi:MAG: M4 family metallopeptidase [Cyclobacteriaceae bacterium]